MSVNEGVPHDSDQAVEFRSLTDDAWHPVMLDLVVNLLFITYVEVYATKKQDVFRPHDFGTLGEVEDFRMRFRPSSESVRDEDCTDVEVGMTVSVNKEFGAGDWRLYDGVVNAVKRVEHDAAGMEDEECRCVFLIFWKHGPLGGTVTSERLDDILFLVPDTRETHHALIAFMDKTRQRFQTQGKRVQSPTSRVVPSDDRDGPALSELHSSLARLRDSLANNWKMPSNELPRTREMQKPLRMPGIFERKPTMSSSHLPPMESSVEGIGSNNGMSIEFRSFRDDAWHGVNLNMTLEGKLAVNYDDYTMFGVEEAHEPDEFNTQGEIEDFRERFRPLSSHLSPEECHEVKVGDLVCVRYGFEGTEEIRFYDAVMNEVIRYQHAVLDDKETCFCSFKIFWKHGPAGGTISTTDIHHICMTVPKNEIHPVLASFLDTARRELGPPWKRPRIDGQNPNLPPGFYAADDHGYVTLSRGEPSTRGKGKNIVINDS